MSCKKGSLLQTDGWKAFQSIYWKNMKMLQDSKSHSGDKRDFKHTSLILNLWGKLKYHIKHAYKTISGDNAAIETFLFEALWRKELKKCNINERFEFLKEASLK
jgi:hypothetical protein